MDSSSQISSLAFSSQWTPERNLVDSVPGSLSFCQRSVRFIEYPLDTIRPESVDVRELHLMVGFSELAGCEEPGVSRI